MNHSERYTITGRMPSNPVSPEEHARPVKPLPPEQHKILLEIDLSSIERKVIEQLTQR